MKDEVYNKNFLKPTNENLERVQGQRGVDSDYKFSYTVASPPAEGETPSPTYIESPQITFNAHLVPPSTGLDTEPPFIVIVRPIVETFLGSPFFMQTSPSFIVEFNEIVVNATVLANYSFSGPAAGSLAVLDVQAMTPNADGGTRVEVFLRGEPKSPGFLVMTVGGAGNIADASGNAFAGDSLDWFVDLEAPQINKILPTPGTSIRSDLFNWKVGIEFNEYLVDHETGWKDPDHYIFKLIAGEGYPPIEIPVLSVSEKSSNMYEYGLEDGDLAIEILLDSTALDGVSDQDLMVYKVLECSLVGPQHLIDRATNGLQLNSGLFSWGWEHIPTDTISPTAMNLLPSEFCDAVPRTFIDPATGTTAGYSFDYVIGFNEAVTDGDVLSNWAVNENSGYEILSVTRLSESELSAFGNNLAVEGYKAAVRPSNYSGTLGSTLEIAHNLTDSAGNLVSPNLSTYTIDSQFVTLTRMSQSQANFMLSDGVATEYAADSFDVPFEFSAPIKTMSAQSMNTFWGMGTPLKVQKYNGTEWVLDTDYEAHINSVNAVPEASSGHIKTHNINLKVTHKATGSDVFIAADSQYRIVFAPNPVLSNGNEASAPMPYGFNSEKPHMADPDGTCAGFGNPLSADATGTSYSNDWTSGDPLYFTVSTTAPNVNLVSTSPSSTAVVDNNQAEFTFQYSGTIDSIDSIEFWDGSVQIPSNAWTVDSSDPTAIRVVFTQTPTWEMDIDARISVNNGESNENVVWSLLPKDMSVEIINHTKNGAWVDIEVELGDDVTDWIIYGIERDSQTWWENNDVSNSLITGTTATLPVELSKSGTYKIYVASVDGGVVDINPFPYRIDYQYYTTETLRIQKDWNNVDLSVGNIVDHMFGPNEVEVLIAFGADCVNPKVTVDYGADGDDVAPISSLVLNPSLSPYADFLGHALYHEPTQGQLDDGMYAQGAIVTIPISTFLYTLSAGAQGQISLLMQEDTTSPVEVYTRLVSVWRPSSTMLQLGRFLKSPFPSSVTPSSDPYSLRVYKLDASTGAPESSPLLTLNGFRRPPAATGDSFLLYGNFYWRSGTDPYDSEYAFLSDDPDGSIQNLPLGRYVVEQWFPMSEWNPLHGKNEGGDAYAYHLVDIVDMGVDNLSVENIDDTQIKVSFQEPTETLGNIEKAAFSVNVGGVEYAGGLMTSPTTGVWEGFTTATFSNGTSLTATVTTIDRDQFQLSPEPTPSDVDVYVSSVTSTATVAPTYGWQTSHTYASATSYAWEGSWYETNQTSSQGTVNLSISPTAGNVLPSVIEWNAYASSNGQLLASGTLSGSSSYTKSFDKDDFPFVGGIELTFNVVLKGKDDQGNTLLTWTSGDYLLDVAAPFFDLSNPISGALSYMNSSGDLVDDATTGSIQAENFKAWTTIWNHREPTHPSFDSVENDLTVAFTTDAHESSVAQAVVGWKNSDMEFDGIVGLVDSPTLFNDSSFKFNLKDPRNRDGWRLWATSTGWDRYNPYSTGNQLWIGVDGVVDEFGNGYNDLINPKLQFNVQEVAIPFFVDAYKTNTSFEDNWPEPNPFMGLHFTPGAGSIENTLDVEYDASRDMFLPSQEISQVYYANNLSVPNTVAYKEQVIDKGYAPPWREITFDGEVKFALELHYSEMVPSSSIPKLIPEVFIHTEHSMPLTLLSGYDSQMLPEAAFAGVLYPLRLKMSAAYSMQNNNNDYGRPDMGDYGPRLDQLPKLRLTKNTEDAAYNFYEGASTDAMSLTEMWVDRGDTSPEKVGHMIRVGFTAEARFTDDKGFKTLSVAPIGDSGRWGIPLVLEIRTKPYYDSKNQLATAGADFLPIWLVFDENKEEIGRYDFLVEAEDGSLYPLGQPTESSNHPHGRRIEFADPSLAYSVLDDGSGIKIDRVRVEGVYSGSSNLAYGG